MKKALLGGLAFILCGCQLTSLFNLFQTGALTSPAHVTVTAPLVSPAHLKGSVAYRIQEEDTSVEEVPVPNVEVYCPYDRTIHATTNDQGEAVIPIPKAKSLLPMVFESEIQASGSVMRLSCFALAGDAEKNPMSASTTLLVAKMGKDIRQYNKTLPEILGQIDMTKLREMTAVLDQDVRPAGRVPREIVDSLFQDTVEPMSDMVAQRVGIDLGAVSQAFISQESTEDFSTCDFAPLINATWQYTVLKGPSSGTWSQTTTVNGTTASTEISLNVADRTFLMADPLVLAWLGKPFEFSVTTNGQNREMSLVNFTLPGGIQNPYFPGIERYTRYTGLTRGTTWTAYDSVVATVKMLLPSMTVGTTTYPKVVQISYVGKDWAGRDRNYTEWRADGVGRIRLVSSDYTTLELKSFTKR